MIIDRREKLLDLFKLSDKTSMKELPLLVDLVAKMTNSSSGHETRSEVCVYVRLWVFFVGYEISFQVLLL